MRLSALSLVALIGCGIEEAEFVETYTNSLCDHVMACSTESVLTFDGIVTVDDCYLDRYNDVGEWGAGCKYRATAAEDCLADMATLTCPAAEGELAERPPSCDFVYFECIGATSDTTDENTTETETESSE